MRRGMSGGLALALLLGLAIPVLAGDKDDQGGSSWWPSWLGGKKKPDPKKEPTLHVTERPVGPAQADLAARLFETERNAYFRRQDAADQMELLAEQAGDYEQVRRVQQLQQRIYAIYLQRTASISGRPGESGVEEPVPEPKPGTGSARTAKTGGANR